MSVDTMERVMDQPVSMISERLPVESLGDHFPSVAWEFKGRSIVLVRADLNPSGAYKWRGADEATRTYLEMGYQRQATWSAGNFASGMIEAARRYGNDLRIGTPETIPEEKYQKLLSLCAGLGRVSVVKYGQTLEETREFIEQTSLGSSEALVNPYDDIYGIAGQGSHLPDVCTAVPGVTHIVVPGGGFSLTMGLVQRAAIEQRAVNVISAVPLGNNSMERTLAAGSRTPLEAWSPNRRYGGAAVRFVGQRALNLAYLHQYPSSNIETVYDEGIIELASDYKSREEGIVPLEPTALLAVQAVRQRIRNKELPEDAVIAILGTGHNEPYTNLLKQKTYRFKTISGYTKLTPPSSR